MAELDDDTELQIEIEKDEPEGLEVEITKAAPEKPDEKDEKAEKVEKAEPVKAEPVKEEKEEPAGVDAAVAELSKQKEALEIRLKTTERTAAQRQADQQRQLVETQLNAVSNALTATEAEIAELRRASIEAQQNGEYDKAADIALQMAEKAADKRDLTRGKSQIENYLKAPQPEIPDDPVEAMIANAARGGQPLSTSAQSWMRKHSEVATDDEMLAKVSDFYDLAVSYAVKKLISLIEPLFLCILGGIVGLIMASMLLPIFDMMQILRGARHN